jgi:hypothetical protein
VPQLVHGFLQPRARGGAPQIRSDCRLDGWTVRRFEAQSRDREQFRLRRQIRTGPSNRRTVEPSSYSSRYTPVRNGFVIRSTPIVVSGP